MLESIMFNKLMGAVVPFILFVVPAFIAIYRTGIHEERERFRQTRPRTRFID